MADKGKHIRKEKIKTRITSRKSKKAPTENKNNSKTKKAAIIASISVAAVLLLGIGVGAIAGHSKTIHPGMMLSDIELGGMTKSEATAALAAAKWESRDFGSVNVQLPAGCSFSVSAEEAGLTMDCTEAAEAAYAFGHSGKPVSDLFAYFKCIGGKATIKDLVETGDNEGISKIIDEKAADLNKLLEKGYIVDEDKSTLTIVKGAGNEKLDNEKLCEMIVAALENGEESLTYELNYADSDSYDFDKLHEDVCVKPKDASYDVKTQKVVESVKGINFNVKDAKKLWSKADNGELVVVPLEITVPKCNLENWDGKLYSDLLGSQSSSYASSSTSRATNVELAASKINGVVLNPGESFSYNEVVGKRTEAAGFKPAGAYANGKVVNEVGGGICQVSSTLYCAVLYANLKVTDRTCHYFAVNYLPSGLDATVSWGGPEFVFKNNRTFPIKIVAKCVNRELTVEIWGTDTDGSYVEVNYSTGSVSGGFAADTYRSVYDKDGNLISRTLEAHSVYHYHEEEKKPASTEKPKASDKPEATATPEPTPAPTPKPAPITPVDIIEEIIDNTPFE